VKTRDSGRLCGLQIIDPDHGREVFTIVCSNRQSISLHDITGIESSVHYRYLNYSRNPAEVMGERLCDSLSRMDNADMSTLLIFFGVVELPVLGGAFFERGLLSLLLHSIDGIALGDNLLRDRTC
jgi:hypothetical protein